MFVLCSLFLGMMGAGMALPTGAMGPAKPCKCDTSYYSGPASLLDLRVAGLWMAELSLRSWFSKRILQGNAVYCDQAHSDDFCDCPEDCEQPQPGTIVTNSNDIERYTKCCPFKFTLCCGCTPAKKKSCMQKCLTEVFDISDGAPVKSHLTFCGYACATCHREFWPLNDEAFCPAGEAMARGGAGGGASDDKKKEAPLWWLKCARSALNILSAQEKGKIPNLADDGSSCGSGGGVGDEEALDHPQVPYAVQQKENEQVQEMANSFLEIQEESNERTKSKEKNKLKRSTNLGNSKSNQIELKPGLLNMLLEMSNHVEMSSSLQEKEQEQMTANAAVHLASIHCRHNICKMNEKKDIVAALILNSKKYDEYKWMLLSISGHVE